MSPRANVLNRTEWRCVGNPDANVLVRDDDSHPAWDKAKETHVQTAARKVLQLQKKERRSKSRKLNQHVDAASEVTLVAFLARDDGCPRDRSIDARRTRDVDARAVTRIRKQRHCDRRLLLFVLASCAASSRTATTTARRVKRRSSRNSSRDCEDWSIEGTIRRDWRSTMGARRRTQRLRCFDRRGRSPTWRRC